MCNIYGEAQLILFKQLYELYEKGIILLLHSPSIRSYIIVVMCYPRFTICTNEKNLISEAQFDQIFFHQIAHCIIPKAKCLHLYTVEQLIGTPLTQYHIVILQKFTATILRCTAFEIQKSTVLQVLTNSCILETKYPAKC